MLIPLTLLIMGVLTIFSIVLGENLSGNILDFSMESTAIINGTASTLEFEGEGMLFAIDPAVVTIGVFVIIALIAGIAGIRFLASGLSDESVKVIIAMIIYGSLWGLLTLLAWPLINAIEVFGVIIYTVLLIGYIVGVIQKTIGGGIA